MTPAASLIGGAIAQLTDSIGRSTRWPDRAESMANVRRTKLGRLI